MNKIISKEQFSEKVFKLEIEAPLIAKSRRAGHFVIVRVDEKGERMPLTIAGSDLNKGTITLVVQTVGLSSGFPRSFLRSYEQKWIQKSPETQVFRAF